MKPNNCTCGRIVEVKYQAGVSRTLAAMMGKAFTRSYPHYYILCACGKYMEIKVTAITEQQRDRQKNLLIRRWNEFERVSEDDIC